MGGEGYTMVLWQKEVVSYLKGGGTDVCVCDGVAAGGCRW